MNRKKFLEDGDKEFLKKTKLLDAMWHAQASLSWWHKESNKLAEESMQIEEDFNKGLISEEEAVKKGKVIESKISYLERKGQFETKNWLNLVSGKNP